LIKTLMKVIRKTITWGVTSMTKLISAASGFKNRTVSSAYKEMQCLSGLEERGCKYPSSDAF
jgi:hypothetical protein